MPDAPATPPDGHDRLASLRARIDAHDRDMHVALLRRGELISELIAAKRTDEPGRVFKPAREASMMAAIAARHSGLEVLAISSVTNIAVDSIEADHITSAEEVWEAVEVIRPNLGRFIQALLPRLNVEAET